VERHGDGEAEAAPHDAGEREPHIGLVVIAAGNAAAVAAAVVGLTLWYRPSQYGN
jgi:hypothetical protein